MFEILRERLKQGSRTLAWPDAPPTLPDRLRGRPTIEPARCEAGCDACARACPTDAISGAGAGLDIDLGRCLFCTACTDACPTGAVKFTPEHRLATRTREGLHLRAGEVYPLAQALDERLRRLFGRSLKLRQVSAGGCNGCEADVNVLSTVVFDLRRFGIDVVASPRHADGLLITGPVPRHMELALRKAWDATPAPKIVVAVGACAISGGPFFDHPEVLGGAGAVVPVDLFVPGCPPHPITILDGMLRLLGQLEEQGRV